MAPELKPILRDWGFEQDNEREYHWRPPTGEHGERAVLIMFAWDVHVFNIARRAYTHMVSALRGDDFEEDADAVGGVEPERFDDASPIGYARRLSELSLPPVPPPTEEKRRYDEYCAGLRGSFHWAYVTEHPDESNVMRPLLVIVWKDGCDQHSLEVDGSYRVAHHQLSDFKFSASLRDDGFVDDGVPPTEEADLFVTEFRAAHSHGGCALSMKKQHRA